MAFVIFAEGQRRSFAQLDSLIRGFGVSSHQITLANVSVTTSGDLGAALYDADEVLRVGPSEIKVHEGASMMYRRRPSGWRISAWVVNSTPASPKP